MRSRRARQSCHGRDAKDYPFARVATMEEMPKKTFT